jgi:hypothetical protein
MKPVLMLAAVIALSSPVFAQAPGPAKFAAADISLRARTGTTNQPTTPGRPAQGPGIFRNATMLDLIATAYSVGDTDHHRRTRVARTHPLDLAAKAPQDVAGERQTNAAGPAADRFASVARRARPAASSCSWAKTSTS